MRPIWAHSLFAVSLRAISGPHSEPWQGLRPFFLRRETKSEGTRKVRIKMKKILIIIAMAISAFVITGCGSKQESIVKELYSSIRSKDNAVAEQFCKAHLDKDVENMLNSREGRELLGNVKKEFGKIAESKDSPKLKIVKEHSDGDAKSALIEAQCAGTTLYFGVEDEKITLITTKADVVEEMLKKD